MNEIAEDHNGETTGNAANKLRRLFTKVLAARRATSGVVLARIDASVVRPLKSLAERSAETISADTLAAAAEPTTTPADVLWHLAEEATSMWKIAGDVELFEAAAALQDLMCNTAESDAIARDRLDKLRVATGEAPTAIRLSPNGRS